MKNVHLLARWLAMPLLLLSLFGDFFATTSPEAQDLSQFYAPPQRIHFVDSQGVFHWRPFVYGRELVDALDVRYRDLPDQTLPLEWFAPGYPYKLLGLFAASRHLLNARAPGSFHPLGTDALGRDVLARAMAAARSSLLVLLCGIAIYSVVGVTIGAIAGLAGGWADTVLMRFSEFVLALPALYLVLALRSSLPPDTPFWQTIVLTAGTIAIVAWPPLARGVRGLILQTSRAGYVEASRILGASPWHIFRKHLAPSLAPYVWAQTIAAAPVFVLGEVVLSFLNVGFQGSGISWGAMLRPLTQEPRILTDFWWNLLPLGLVFCTLLCVAGFSERTAARNPTQLA
jgi:peptide/nickel transport system permease protein